MKINCFLTIVVATGGLLTAPFAAAAQDTVKVGMVMPLTGALAGAGKQVVAGARFYMRQHGDTVAGKKLELIVRDDTTVFDVGKRLIQELIVNDKVNIIAGGITGDLQASASLITEAKKPTVIMLASTSSLIDKSPYFVRTSCTLAQSSAIVADWAVQQGLAKVVTFVTDFSPGHEAETTFKGRYLAAGGQIVEQIRIPLQNPDFAPFLQRARDANPQAIFAFVPSAQAATLVKQFAERGMDKQSWHQVDRARRYRRRRAPPQYGRCDAWHHHGSLLLGSPPLTHEPGVRRRIPEGSERSSELHGGQRLRRHAPDL
jgi:branched-chain amino acid transport system substrate-binding protein